MTVGTAGNDNLTNDPNVYDEVIDALGGDDAITIQQPLNFQYSQTPSVVVNGGEGFDTLTHSGVTYRGVTATGFDGGYTGRINSSRNYTVNWSSIEKLQLTGGLFGSDVMISTGDAIAILKLSGTIAGNVTVTTGGGDDQITLRSGSAAGTGGGEITGNVLINAGGGADYVDLTGINSSTGRTVYGESGNDTLLGSSKGDTLYGGDDNDHLDGGAAADALHGGAGNDTYVVDNAGDQVVEGVDAGTDEVRTALGSRSDYTQLYSLPAHVENFTGTSSTGQGVSGNALDNVIEVGAGADLVVIENGGADSVSGGGGNDFLYYGGAFTNADANNGGAGLDTVALVGNYDLTFDTDDLVSIERLTLYSSGNPSQPAGYKLATNDANVASGELLTVIGRSLTASEALTFDGSAEKDGKFAIYSGAGADTLTGGAKNDVLNGGAGSDVLFGGEGKDLIIGGLGADTLWGGTERDVFAYSGAAQSNTQNGVDSIRDFQVGVDKINLRQFDANGDASDGITPLHLHRLQRLQRKGRRAALHQQRHRRHRTGRCERGRDGRLRAPGDLAQCRAARPQRLRVLKGYGRLGGALILFGSPKR
jgi:Ca2+-binding RTX toxin-like protein